MGSNQRFEDLMDVLRWNANLLVSCSFHCGNESIVDAARLARWYRIHCWRTSMGMIGQHLRCSQCWGRPEYIRVTKDPPTGPRWGPQSEADWVRAVKRLRG